HGEMAEGIAGGVSRRSRGPPRDGARRTPPTPQTRKEHTMLQPEPDKTSSPPPSIRFRHIITVSPGIVVALREDGALYEALAIPRLPSGRGLASTSHSEFHSIRGAPLHSSRRQCGPFGTQSCRRRKRTMPLAPILRVSGMPGM